MNSKSLIFFRLLLTLSIFFLYLTPAFAFELPYLRSIPNKQINDKKIIKGKIVVLDKNHVSINKKIFKTINKPLIIYTNQLESELINLEEIPENINGQCILNQDNKIKTIKISERQENKEKVSTIKILEFEEAVYDFKLSNNAKQIAYYDFVDKLLKIVDLCSGEIIWQTSISYPNFDWHPKKPILAFSDSTDTGYKISLINTSNLCNQLLLNQDKVTNQYVNYLCWSPDGKVIVYTILEGTSDAHGYVTNLNIIDNSGKFSSLSNFSDINFVTWSPSGKYLAFNRFLETDISTSIVGVFDLLTSKVRFMNTENTSQINPIFTPDEKNLIYCDINGLSEKIIIYNLEKHKKNVLTEELKYIDDFCWLDNENLVYTFGDLPQIKIFNISNLKSTVVDQGFSPVTINNGLYFLKAEPNKQSTSLYFYHNQN